MRIIGNDPSVPRQTHEVASGTLTNGKTVILNADGTVSVVSETSGGAGSFAQYSASQYQSVGTFDSTNNKVVIAYNKHGDSFHADAIVGTVSGSSISFGTAVEFNAAHSDNLSIGFDANAGKVLIAWSASGSGRAIVGTVSGTSISFGSSVEFNSGGSATQTAPIVYDANAQKLVIFYRNDGNSYYGTAIVATISGTSVSFGTRVVFVSNGFTYPTGAAYHAAAQKVVCIFQDWGSSLNDFKPYGIVGTVSGTSISFGSAVAIDSSTGDEPSCAYDSVNQKIVASFYNDGGTNKITAAVGTVSGTSISFGTPVGMGTSIGSSEVAYLSSVYDSGTGRVVFSYRDSNKGYVVTALVSGTSLTASTPVATTTFNIERGFLTYDSNSSKLVVGWRDNTSSPFPGKAATVVPIGSTDAGSYIGVAAEAISNTATGSITINGGINEGQSSLAIGTVYYVADNGTLQTTNNGRKIGKAITATKILVNSNMSGDEMNAYLGGLV
jgi:hypothetical protein